MLRVIACCVLAGSLASPPARADGLFYNEGIGVSRVKDQLGATFGDSPVMRAQLGAGYRGGMWALEATVSRVINAGPQSEATPDLFTYGLRLKRSMTLAHNLELYVHGSATIGALAVGSDIGRPDWSGRGLGFGAGIQWKGRGSVLGLLFIPLFWLVPNGPKMTGAMFIDDGYELYRLHEHGDFTRPGVDAQITTLTFGLGVGTDF
jgi:hypothetical protein